MHAYNPRKKSFHQLENSLVGTDRWDILKIILIELLFPAGEKPRQHRMIIGPRGIGKSHLMTLLYYKIKDDSQLRNLWIPILFPEEMRMASNLARFLERAVHEIILEMRADDPQTANELTSKIELTKNLPPDERDEYLFSIFTWIHQVTGKFILFINENLQYFLGKKISLIEQKKLRAFLQTNDAVTLLGSATTVFNALYDHSHPFYHFFHINRLKDLTFEEMKILIGTSLSASGLPEVSNKVLENEARLRALFSFAGGNPRMAIFLADILKTDVPDDMLDLMDSILDELTPYFESIFNDVPDYQVEIINSLAAYEPAQSPKEIAAHLESQSTTIRNYLKQLKDNGYVRIAFSRGRSNYYCLNEYLYRIWFQMRDSGHREETRWLLELLLMLYSPSRILEEKEKIVNSCQRNHKSMDSYSNLIGQAVDFMHNNPEYSRIIEWCVKSTKPGKKIRRGPKDYKEISELIKNEDFDKAIEALVSFVKNNPDVEWAYGLWGNCLKSQKYFEQAIEKYKKSLEINPTSSLAFWQWGDCLRSLGEYDEAIEKFEKVIEINPENCSAYGAKGDCFKELGKYDEAEKYYDRAIAVDPQYLDAYMAYGDCLKRQGKYDEAIEKFQKITEINPEFYIAYGAWGNCLSRQKKYDEAIEKISKILEINPDDFRAYGAIGDNFKFQNKYDEAIENFNKAVKINPKDSESYWRLGFCFKEKNEYGEAIKLLKQSIKIDPQNYVAYGVWGDCLRQTEKYHEAEKKYKKSISINPLYPDAYAAWGCCLARMGQYEKALEKYKKSIEYDSTKGESPCKCYINSLRELKRFDEIIAIYKKSLLEIDSCSEIFEYGNVLLEAGKYEEAVKQLSKLIMNNGSCSRAYLPYGRALAAIGRHNDALGVLLKYIKSNFDNYFTELDFLTLFNNDVLPLLEKIDAGQYIEKLYSTKKEKSASKIQLCQALVLLGKYDVVSEYIKIVLSNKQESNNNADEDAVELLFFTIKFALWIKLCQGNIHEALRLVEIYSEYIKSLKTRKKKEAEVASLALGHLRLQITNNVEPEHTRKIFLFLEGIKEIPFDYVLHKVLRCISTPESLDAKQFLTEKVIAGVVNKLKSVKKKEKTVCDSCVIS